MRYYVVSDPHAYFTEMKEALDEAGYFQDKDPHKLIICGDIMDRGRETLEMQEFIYGLLKKDEVILIRGNHEDLMQEMLDRWLRGSYLDPIHLGNGTVDTAAALGQLEMREFDIDPVGTRHEIEQSPFVKEIMPAMVDYFETANYIFVHGWIPFHIKYIKNEKKYTYMENWRQLASEKDWRNARWINGMLAAHYGVVEPDKTIVCGHWHCSYGHAHYEGIGSEHGSDANFTPYYGKGIIAIDACTTATHKVNCIVIED